MVKKIGLAVSVILLAASAFLAAMRVQGDEAARDLYPAAQKAADIIAENGLSDVEEYQKFVADCNRAMAGRSKRKEGMDNEERSAGNADRKVHPKDEY